MFLTSQLWRDLSVRKWEREDQAERLTWDISEHAADPTGNRGKTTL